MVIHALHDLSLQMGLLPIPLVEVPIDTAMLIYGIVLLRRATATQEIPGEDFSRRPAASIG